MACTTNTEQVKQWKRVENSKVTQGSEVTPFYGRFSKKIWVNSFTVSKTFEKWYIDVNLGEVTFIAFVFREGYKKIETTSESVYPLKRLSNYLNKWVKSKK